MAITSIVSLVDDGGLVGVFEGVTVDTVVRCVQLALDKPGIVTMLEAASMDGLEVTFPCE